MANYRYINATGLIVPDTGELKTEVESEFRQAFGADLIVDANSPQGVLITAETLARAAVVGNNAAVANQINPNLAEGIFLDAIWALTGGQRYAATKSTIESVRLTGVAGTVVPAGSLASLIDGTLFESVASATIGTNGTVTVGFIAVEAGPIVAAIGDLSQVVTAVLGWDQVTNLTAAVLGQNGETNPASRLRRKNTLALQGVALPQAITSALYDLVDVKSLTFRENVTDEEAVIDGITLVPHSIWVCVDGATDVEVADSLLMHKSLGAGWNGSVEIDRPDPVTGQVYRVKFDRPTDVPIKAKITIKSQPGATGLADLVRQAIVDYANGEIDGEAGFVVGSSVSAFELAGAVSQQVRGIYIMGSQVAESDATTWTDQVVIALDQKATILFGAIEVIIV